MPVRTQAWERGGSGAGREVMRPRLTPASRAGPSQERSCQQGVGRLRSLIHKASGGPQQASHLREAGEKVPWVRGKTLDGPAGAGTARLLWEERGRWFDLPWAAGRHPAARGRAAFGAESQSADSSRRGGSLAPARRVCLCGELWCPQEKQARMGQRQIAPNGKGAAPPQATPEVAPEVGRPLPRLRIVLPRPLWPAGIPSGRVEGVGGKL